VSFEPLASARVELERRAAIDESWSVLPLALGDTNGTTVLHIAGNSGSSSVLEMLDRHQRAAPISAYVGEENVEMRRLDSLLDELMGSAKRPFLKLDVQGYELAVLRGAGDRLKTFCAIQLELSTVPLYADAPLREEVERFLVDAGFVLAGVIQGFSDPISGQMLQLDGLFVRRDLLP
jgi:FkbM family methyltransferase